jgi:tRNA(Ile)-lysidine synthase
VPEKVDSNIQAKAREARYCLLTNYCQQNDIIHLLTGHHLEDRVENFFIKLSRASGIFGLIEPCQNFTDNVRICKPLLNFTKEECSSILKEKNVAHVEDPSNQSLNYFRNEIRHKLTDFFDLKFIASSLFQSRIAASQEHLASSAKLIQEQVIAALCECVTIYSQGFAIIKLESFLLCHMDIKNYLLSYLLKIISGDDSDVRSEKIAELIGILNAKTFKALTLGKCIVDLAGKDIIIYKEKCYIQSEVQNLQKNLFWDRRFSIQTTCENLTVSMLELSDYKEIKDRVDFQTINDAGKHTNKILFTLPVIKRLEKIVSIPNIDYYDELTKEDIRINFTPWYNSKIIHLNIKNNYTYE